MPVKQPIRIGLIGLGGAGWGMHLKELQQHTQRFKVVAVCDIDPVRTEAAAEQLNCATYRRVEDLVADENVELIDIASMTTQHVDHALIALKAGKHVFLEKPIATTYEEARRLKPAANRSDGNLYIRHNRRFEPAFVHIREIIDSGILGDVFCVKLRRHNFQRRNDWQTVIRTAGGQTLNWGPHLIDHALRLLDSPLKTLNYDAKRVACIGNAEDHFKAILIGRNGRMVDVEVSGGVAIPEPIYHVAGTRGALVCHNENAIKLRYLDPRSKPHPRELSDEPRPFGGRIGMAGKPDKLKWVEKQIEVKPKAPCGLSYIWKPLYEAIRLDKPFPITLDEALEVMRVLSQIKRDSKFKVTRTKKRFKATGAV